MTNPKDSRPVWELVIQDMRERDDVGRHRYGTPLQSHNGRDALVDVYQEALDLCVYLRQAIIERDHVAAVTKSLADRVAAQSELLAKNAEKVTPSIKLIGAQMANLCYNLSQEAHAESPSLRTREIMKRLYRQWDETAKT